MFCIKCGKEIVDGARFCSGCGREVKEIGEEAISKQEKEIKYNLSEDETRSLSALRDSSDDLETNKSLYENNRIIENNRKELLENSMLLCAVIAIAIAVLVGYITFSEKKEGINSHINSHINSERSSVSSSKNSYITIKHLSSEFLGTPTPFTYNNATYLAYNSFIQTTSGSDWQDAQDFVAALNDAEPEGEKTWMLLNSPGMAYEWWLTTGDKEGEGEWGFDSVIYVWSSKKCDDSDAVLWDCTQAGLDAACRADGEEETKHTKYNAWRRLDKSYSLSNNGFVVIRGSGSN